MKVLLVVTAAVEAGAGLALLGFPAMAVGLLLGPALEASAPMAAIRTAGAVLLALGALCWLASRAAHGAARRMVAGMACYNPGAALALAVVGMRASSPGILLWPAVALHAAMGAWCISSLLRGKNPLNH
jgi:hypothetical protein